MTAILNFIEMVRRDGSRTRVSETDIPGLRFNFLGTNNHIIIHENTKFHDCSFTFISNMSVEIGKTKHQISRLYLFGNGSDIKIGDDFSCWGCEIRCHEKNTRVSIGNDCMFSEDILIYPTDVHSIYDENTKELLNIGEPITIGNHVWCCRGVRILKGAFVNDNSIIGMNSMVTKKFLETNLVILGSPAKIQKQGVNWSRESPAIYLENLQMRTKQ